MAVITGVFGGGCISVEFVTAVVIAFEFFAVEFDGDDVAGTGDEYT